MNLCWTILSVTSIFFLSFCQANIFVQEERSNAILPKEINLRNVNAASFYESLISSRIKRQAAAPTSDHDQSTGELEWTMMILGNATNHNQALIHWSGDNSTIVFILTRKKSATSAGGVTESTLWRSIDYGKTYVKENAKFSKGAVLKSYYVCPTNKYKVIFVDTLSHSQKIWVSSNEGATYTSHTVPFSVDKIEFHPDISDWVLGYDKGSKTLWASKNLGKDWNQMQEHVTVDRYYWYVKGVDTGPRAQEVVHIEYRDWDALPNEIYLIKSCLIPNCTTPSPFQKHATSLGNIDKDSLVVQDDYIVAQKSGSSVKLYVSYRRNEFRKAKFTIYQPQTDFHLISTDNDCIVIGVNDNKNMTRLFFSDKEGYNFRMSMLHDVRYFGRKVGDNKVYTVDIHEVAGLFGVYIANVAVDKNKVETKITRDYGKTWSYIDHVENKPDCLQNCKLNLHLAMDQTRAQYYMPSIVSKKTVPGLIVAHGVYGERLQDHPVSVNVYVSEDGGQSWHLALNQRHLIVMADHGSILVCIKMIFLQPVSHLKFSNDAGKQWKSYNFSHEQINVDGILTEPGEHTFFLTLFGHQTYRDSWRVYQINMKSLFRDKQCSHPDDFETKTFNEPCANGMTYHMEVLKPGRKCLVGLSYKRKSTMERCQCQQTDYECDVGYIKSNGACEKKRIGPIDTIPSDDFLNKEDNTTPCVDGQRVVPTGWRKRSGDNCTNDLPNIFNKTESCQPPTETEIRVEMHNVTNRAAIGESLYFSVQGTSHKISWVITKTTEVTPVQTLEQSDDFHVKVSSPGLYKVRASASDATALSDTVIVEFWYPIKRVNVYVPPVVATNRVYNATATVETVYDIRGNYTQVGPVKYSWLTDGEMIVSKNNKLTNLHYDTVGAVHIKVTADNDVSYQTAKEQINVKLFVQEVVFSLTLDPPLNQSHLNSKWLDDFKKIFSFHVMQLDKVKNLFKLGKLAKEENLHVYIGPEVPLQLSLFLAPTSDEREKDLLAAAVDIQKFVMQDLTEFPIVGHDVMIQDSFLINGEGEFIPYQDGGVSAVVVILAVVLVLLVIGALLFIFRRYIKALRLGSYFRNVRNVSVPGMPHIVRNQNNDLSPIVGNEFIDDDLDDTMNTISTDQGTLEFHG